MGIVEVTLRVEKVLGQELGLGVVGVAEAEGGASQLVVSVGPGSVAAAAGLRPGDRLLRANGVVCDCLGRMVNGIAHKVRSPTDFDIRFVDFFVQRHYPQRPQKRSVRLEKAGLGWLAVEWDGSVVWAPSGSGLQRGDLVMEVEGKAVEAAEGGTLGATATGLLAAAAGPTLELKVERGRLGAAGEAALESCGGRRPQCDYLLAHFSAQRFPTLPVTLFGKDGEGAVWLSRVDAASQAGLNQLLPLDRVCAVNGRAVRSVAECGALLGQAAGTFWLLVERSLCVARLLQINKAVWPAAGTRGPWPLPAAAPDIVQLRETMLAARQNGSPRARFARSISRDRLALRRLSRERSRSQERLAEAAADPPTDPTPSPDPSEEALGPRPSLSFRDAVHTVLIHMDVVPKRIRRS